MSSGLLLTVVGVALMLSGGALFVLRQVVLHRDNAGQHLSWWRTPPQYSRVAERATMGAVFLGILGSVTASDGSACPSRTCS